MKATIFSKTMLIAVVGLSFMVTVFLGSSAKPLSASCLTLMCDESLFFHINGGQEYTAVHAPAFFGVFSLGGGGTRTNQATNINQRNWTAGSSCDCRQPPPNDNEYYKCDAVTGTSTGWWQITRFRCIS